MICAAGHSAASALSTTAEAFVRAQLAEVAVVGDERDVAGLGALDPGEPADLDVGVADDAAPDAGCEIPDGPLHGSTSYLFSRLDDFGSDVRCSDRST